MSEEKNLPIDMDWKPEKIQESKIFCDPEKARILLQKDKNQILTLLTINGEMTIQELSKSAGINPGTIKRHIDDLIVEKLVFKSSQKRSEYNVKMKYYSAAADEYIIDIHIPEKNEED
jgi:predicted transcriptional regulator